MGIKGKNKKWLGFVIVAFVIVAIIASNNTDDSQSKGVASSDVVGKVTEDSTVSDYSSEDILDYISDFSDDSSDTRSNLSLGQQNALSKAGDYLNYSAFHMTDLLDNWFLKVILRMRPHMQQITVVLTGMNKRLKKQKII